MPTIASIAGPSSDELFHRHFLREVTKLKEGSDIPPEKWSAAGKSKKALGGKGEGAEWWAHEGPHMVQSWMEWRKSVPWAIWTTPDKEPAIEIGLLIQIGETQFKGFIDRIFMLPNGDLCIVDLKSGSRTPDSDLQLGMYAIGIEKAFGVRPKWGAYWMARTGQLSDRVDLGKYSEGMVSKWLERYWAIVDQGLYLPHVTNMCRACDMNRFCAAYGGEKAYMDPDYEPPLFQITERKAA
ncbi:PD-(D/E)XK nuclease family protein [Longispora urticae]